MCSVFMQESEKVVSISSDHLEPITPTKNNKVRVAVITNVTTSSFTFKIIKYKYQTPSGVVPQQICLLGEKIIVKIMQWL